MKGLLILADGFEISEALVPCDYLFRSGIDVAKVSLNDKKEVMSQENIKVVCDLTFDYVDLKDYDFLFIPGGKAAYLSLDKDNRVIDTINYFVSHNKLVTSICAAPFLIGKLGYFSNKEFTCFPSFEKYVKDGIYKKDSGVVVIDGFITAKSVYYASAFAIEIIRYLKGNEEAERVLLQVKGEL